MHEIWRNIWTGLTTASPLDQVNLVPGITGVWLMTRRNLWAFPVGLVAVSVQCVLFFRARFYADATLQAFFFAALAWGWRHWVRDRGAAPELPITTLSWRGRAGLLLGVGLTTTVWALVLQEWTDARMPWRDASIAAFQVAGQVLQARKKFENWAMWTVANLIAIPTYWSAELAYTAFLFGIYFVLGLVGWRTWWTAMKASRSENEAGNAAGAAHQEKSSPLSRKSGPADKAS